MQVGDALARSARLHPERVAAICGDESIGYRELDARSNRLAHALLSLGLAAGERVGALLENSIRCVELDFALAKPGLVRVSLNPRLTAREAEFILVDADARVLVYESCFDAVIDEIAARIPVERFVRIPVPGAGAAEASPRGAHLDYEAFVASGSPQAVDAAELAPESLYCLFYTSGTTGRPKGVMLSHRAMLQVAFNLLMETGPLDVGEKVLLMQPLSHGAGFFVLPYVMKGGCAVIMRQFDPEEVLSLARAHDIESIKLIPTMLQRVLRVPGVESVRLPRLRQMIYGASPMPAEPLRRAIEIFGPGRLVQIYGQSECPVTLTILTREEHRLDNPHPERLTSAGRPWASVEVGVVDDTGRLLGPGEVGEVVVRGPHLMSGYWKRPEATAQAIRDGWLHTSDMGRIDDAGLVYLLGRKDEMIISGGYNIAPREIEDVLYQHGSLHEAAVVGEPDPEWGQAVVAYVVPREAQSDLAALDAHARRELGFKRPKRYYVMRELPKNPAGKIQKKGLSPSDATHRVASGELQR